MKGNVLAPNQVRKVWKLIRPLLSKTGWRPHEAPRTGYWNDREAADFCMGMGNLGFPVTPANIKYVRKDYGYDWVKPVAVEAPLPEAQPEHRPLAKEHDTTVVGQAFTHCVASVQDMRKELCEHRANTADTLEEVHKKLDTIMKIVLAVAKEWKVAE